MVKKNSKVGRVDPDFEAWLRRVGLNRVRVGADDKIRSPREVQKLIMRAPSIKKVDLEITNLPTKEYLRRKRKRR